MSTQLEQQREDQALGAAWRRAEAALPEDWTLEIGLWRAEPNRPAGMLDYEAEAKAYNWHRADAGEHRIARGATATEALTALADALEGG